MNAYTMELFADERRKDRLAEAQQGRRLRSAATRTADPASTDRAAWRDRLSFAYLRRMARIAAAR